MTILTNNLSHGKLDVVNVAKVKNVSGQSGIVGYEVVTTYSGAVANKFKMWQSARHGARIVDIVYNPGQNTTAVTYDFDDHDSLNPEDAHYRARLFYAMMSRRIKKK